MQIKFQVQESELEFTFTISRGSKNTASTVLLEIEHKGLIGYGEAVFSRFYGESIETILEFYTQINRHNILADLDIFNIQNYERIINDFDTSYFPNQSNQAAKAGLDIALYDLRAKKLEMPLFQYLGLDPKQAPKTSYTIGIADLETIKHKILQAQMRGYDILKIKLGCPDDLAIIKLAREIYPEATIRVDANAAWDLDSAINILQELEKYNIEFVEEPLRLDSKAEDYAKLYQASPLPLMADESCHTLKDIAKCSQYFHSINIKHTKSGGLTETIRMIHAARALDLKIMLGCFTETSRSISAFAHLSPLVDYADLDGSLLLRNDPYNSILFDKNQIRLNNNHGLGLIS